MAQAMGLRALLPTKKRSDEPRVILGQVATNPPEGDKGPTDMMLLAKGGTARLLRIERSGKLIASESIGSQSNFLNFIVYFSLAH